MTVTIHQPEHLPWLGFIDKISRADLYVIFDNTQFKKHYFENRNRVRSKSEKGFSWLTIPVIKQSLSTHIKDIEISYKEDWISRYLNILHDNYKEAPYLERYYVALKNILEHRHKLLIDVNLEIIDFVFTEFGVTTKTVKSSSLELPDVTGSDIVLAICQAVNAGTYLSGRDGRNYLDLESFGSANIDVIYHDFKHPEYSQVQGGFEPGMAAIDLLMNHGPEKAHDILFSSIS